MNIVFGKYRLTTDHPASSYGQPVLLIAKEVYGYGDLSVKMRNDVEKAAANLGEEERLAVQKFIRGPTE